MFAQQIGRNVQVYVDEMLVKSLREDDHLIDLQETFDTLQTYNMKLNPSKCVFGVTAGKFLGFMVSQRGIEVNPQKNAYYNGLSPSEDGQGGVEPKRQHKLGHFSQSVVQTSCS